MSLYSCVRDLPLRIDGYRLEPRELDVGAGWTRRTTVVHLEGAGAEGCGEDVTYQEEDQLLFQRAGARLPLASSGTFDDFSRRLDRLDLFPTPPVEPHSRLYRRWAFESAALDLALGQSGSSLADVLSISPAPVEFVLSTGLGQPATIEPLRRRMDLYPGVKFKVDFSRSWDEALVAELSATGAVLTVDLKGQYHGAFRGPEPDPRMYRVVAEGLPNAFIEDPAWNRETILALEGHLERVTWDAPQHSLADLIALSVEPRAINVKPSRLGLVSELFRVYEYCAARNIEMYGGGQFELGPGRGQIQYLAALFHPRTPNDVAPAAYNDASLVAGLPTSPLEPTPSTTGFRWE